MYLANIFLGCFNVKKYSRKIYLSSFICDVLKTEILIRYLDIYVRAGYLLKYLETLRA